MADKAGEDTRHGQHVTAIAGRHAATRDLMEPASSVLQHYFTIQASLAGGSLDGVSQASQAISKLVKSDEMQTLPREVATQADTLAQAEDLVAARKAFKPLSALLIDFLEKQEARSGHYYALYCPMAQAGWLQTDKTVRNPYFGAAMLHCGEVTQAL